MVERRNKDKDQVTWIHGSMGPWVYKRGGGHIEIAEDENQEVLNEDDEQDCLETECYQANIVSRNTIFHPLQLQDIPEEEESDSNNNLDYPLRGGSSWWQYD